MSPLDSQLLIAPILFVILGLALLACWTSAAELVEWARRQRELDRLWDEEAFPVIDDVDDRRLEMVTFE